MRIIIAEQQQEDQVIKFEDLKPGTVFEFGPCFFGSGIKALKLEDGKYVLLTQSDGADWFAVGVQLHASYGVSKVYGTLVGLEIRA